MLVSVEKNPTSGRDQIVIRSDINPDAKTKNGAKRLLVNSGGHRLTSTAFEGDCVTINLTVTAPLKAAAAAAA